MSQEFAQTSSQERQLLAAIFNVFQRGDVGHEVGTCGVPRAGRTIQPENEKRPVGGATVGRGGDRVTLDEDVVSRADRHFILLASG